MEMFLPLPGVVGTLLLGFLWNLSKDDEYHEQVTSIVGFQQVGDWNLQTYRISGND